MPLIPHWVVRCPSQGGETVLDLSVIEDEITAIETESETTYDACEKLACLYTVRDHLKAKDNNGDEVSSEFLTASIGIPIPDLMKVIDEHMEAIKIVYPSEYAAIVSKIKALHGE